ncbi:protein of unknown function [Candidatus Nitrosocosmicus franklandus]|uniref:Uncharacterized protein n=1 Tax=Candidatus Nitrosocosmicus franklandianus TaxID=1798806 RepID=A0A484I4J1_9ARCH|nr:protein of unknown function [Candidatus Nitrosocosmicus franklandus]
MSHPNAKQIIEANSTALLFNKGNDPGNPRQIGQVFSLGNEFL